MFVVQISDREVFVAMAKRLQKPVSVVRSTTVIPVEDEEKGAIMMHPAVALDYVLEFQDRSLGETRWTFREIVLTDAQGEALLTKSLWARLQQEPYVHLAHRSGSF